MPLSGATPLSSTQVQQELIALENQPSSFHLNSPHDAKKLTGRKQFTRAVIALGVFAATLLVGALIIILRNYSQSRTTSKKEKTIPNPEPQKTAPADTHPSQTLIAHLKSVFSNFLPHGITTHLHKPTQPLIQTNNGTSTTAISKAASATPSQSASQLVSTARTVVTPSTSTTYVPPGPSVRNATAPFPPSLDTAIPAPAVTIIELLRWLNSTSFGTFTAQWKDGVMISDSQNSCFYVVNWAFIAVDDQGRLNLTAADFLNPDGKKVIKICGDSGGQTGFTGAAYVNLMGDGSTALAVTDPYDPTAPHVNGGAGYLLNLTRLRELIDAGQLNGTINLTALIAQYRSTPVFLVTKLLGPQNTNVAFFSPSFGKLDCQKPSIALAAGTGPKVWVLTVDENFPTNDIVDLAISHNNIKTILAEGEEQNNRVELWPKPYSNSECAALVIGNFNKYATAQVIYGPLPELPQINATEYLGDNDPTKGCTFRLVEYITGANVYSLPRSFYTQNGSSHLAICTPQAGTRSPEGVLILKGGLCAILAPNKDNRAANIDPDSIQAPDSVIIQNLLNNARFGVNAGSAEDPLKQGATCFRIDAMSTDLPNSGVSYIFCSDNVPFKSSTVATYPGRVYQTEGPGYNAQMIGANGPPTSMLNKTVYLYGGGSKAILVVVQAPHLNLYQPYITLHEGETLRLSQGMLFADCTYSGGNSIQITCDEVTDIQILVNGNLQNSFTVEDIANGNVVFKPTGPHPHLRIAASLPDGTSTQPFNYEPNFVPASRTPLILAVSGGALLLATIGGTSYILHRRHLKALQALVPHPNENPILRKILEKAQANNMAIVPTRVVLLNDAAHPVRGGSTCRVYQARLTSSPVKQTKPSQRITTVKKGKAATKQPEQEVVVKVINRNLDDKQEGQFAESIQREVDNLIKFRQCPNIVSCLGVTTVEQGGTDDRLGIVMEDMSLGSLTEFLQSHQNKISCFLACNIALQLINAIAYLHGLTPPFIHRDIKSLNVFLKDFDELLETVRVCLGDLGTARATSDNTMTAIPGTLAWSAPESFASNYTTAVDIYAFGVVLWEIFTQAMPWHDIENPLLIIDNIQHGIRPRIPPTVPWVFRDLIECCWAKNPNDRPTAGKIQEILKPLLETAKKYHVKNYQSLANAIQTGQQFPPIVICSIMLDILKEVETLHKANQVKGNINSSEILISFDKNGRPTAEFNEFSLQPLRLNLDQNHTPAMDIAELDRVMQEISTNQQYGTPWVFRNFSQLCQDSEQPPVTARIQFLKDLFATAREYNLRVYRPIVKIDITELSPIEICRIILSLLKALESLYAKSMVKGPIRLSDVLIGHDENGQPTAEFNAFSLEAPYLKLDPHNKAAIQEGKENDMYAMGIFMAAILTRQSIKIIEQKIHDNKSIFSAVPEDAPAMQVPQLVNLVMRCLAQDPQTRPISTEASSIVSSLLSTLEEETKARKDAALKAVQASQREAARLSTSRAALHGVKPRAVAMQPIGSSTPATTVPFQLSPMVVATPGIPADNSPRVGSGGHTSPSPLPKAALSHSVLHRTKPANGSGGVSAAPQHSGASAGTPGPQYYAAVAV